MTRQKCRSDASKEEILQDAREVIEMELPYIGIKPYSNTRIGLRLRSVESKLGKEAANSLVEEFSLENYGFNKE